MARKTIAELEAELVKAKTEIEAWKEAHAALARACQQAGSPYPVYVPYSVPAIAPQPYAPYSPFLPWYEVYCSNIPVAYVNNGSGGGGGGGAIFVSSTATVGDA